MPTPHQWKNVERGLYRDKVTGQYYQRIRRTKKQGGDTWQCLFTDMITEARSRLEARRLAKHAAALGLKVNTRETPEVTVSAILDEFERAGMPNITGHERMRVEHCVRALPCLREKLGGYRISKLKQAVFDDYHDWRIKKVKKGMGHRTTDLDILTLSAALTWGVRKGLCETNPAEKAKRYVDPRKVRHAKDVAFTSMDEAHAYAGELMTNPRGESAAWQLLFATTTGQRSEELLQMRVDADPGEPGSVVGDRLFVHRAKNPKIVNPSCYIHDGLKEVIEKHGAWLKRRYPGCPWYFPGRGGNGPLSETALCQVMRKTWKRRAKKNPNAAQRTPQGCRASYVTIRRSQHEPDNRIRWEINHNSPGTLEAVYGGIPSTWADGKGQSLSWKPTTVRAAWESIGALKAAKEAHC